MLGPMPIFPELPKPKPMCPAEIGAAVAQFHAHGIYGWPMLGGGYKSVSEWAEERRAEYTPTSPGDIG